MKIIKAGALICTLALITTSVTAQPAKSLKHAKKVTEWRQDVFQLLYSNMGPMGAMAKGKIPLNKTVIEKNALRINQLSLMITDYLATDTRNFDVKTEALPKVWTNSKELSEKANALTLASANLQKVVINGDDKAIKKAIGDIGETCGGCHDVFKKD
jgi:cytochrome c556